MRPTAPENFDGDAATDRLDPTWKTQVDLSRLDRPDSQVYDECEVLMEPLENAVSTFSQKLLQNCERINSNKIMYSGLKSNEYKNKFRRASKVRQSFVPILPNFLPAHAFLVGQQLFNTAAYTLS